MQLYHRFEAAYYAQILSHHADQLIPPEKPFAGMARSSTSQNAAFGYRPNVTERTVLNFALSAGQPLWVSPAPPS
ncbi:MAG: hypothetical protein WJ306_09835 [Ferrovum myxofaciens]